MAKLSGFKELHYKLKQSSIEVFKEKVRNIVETMNSYRDLFMRVQRARLTNPYIKDGNTTYPHTRSGNMLRRLVDTKMERYRVELFKESFNKITYTHYTTNMLDGGNSGRSTVYRRGKGGNFNYAHWLETNKRSRYKGYFGRLQQTFKTNYMKQLRSTIGSYIR